MKSKLELSLEAVEDFIREFEILDDLDNREKIKVLEALVREFAKRVSQTMNEKEKIFAAVMGIDELLKGLFPDARWIKRVRMGGGQFSMEYQDFNYNNKKVRW